MIGTPFTKIYEGCAPKCNGNSSLTPSCATGEGLMVEKKVAVLVFDTIDQPHFGGGST